MPSILTFFLYISARKITSLHLLTSLRVLIVLDMVDVTREDVVIERETSDYEAGENTAFGELLSRRLGLLLIALLSALVTSGVVKVTILLRAL